MNMSNPSQDSMALIVESASNAMLLADAGGKIVLVNAQTEKLFGYSRTELLGKKVELLVPELQRRGLFRTEYEGKTLRDNLGFARPKSRWEA